MKKLILLLILILVSIVTIGQEARFENGQIKIYNQLPRRLQLENGSFQNGFRSTTKEYRYTLGFRDIVNPVLTQYQKRDTIYFDVESDYFTYSIKDFTQNEIDIYDQNQLDNDTSAQKNDSYKNDGQIAHRRIWDRIMREYDTGNITNTQFEAMSVILFDATLPLELGLWKVAKSRLDVITPPTNSKMLAILNKVKQIINDYIAINY